MNEKHLVQKLAALKSVTARPDWVKKNREVLSYQIFNGKESVGVELSFFNRLGLFTHHLLQPSSVASLIVLFFIVSGIISINASQGATPKDVLYIAKIISEKAEFAVAFDDKSKAELNVRYAKNRAAELNKIITSSPAAASDSQVQELSDNFKKEIAAVRERLHKLDTEASKQATIEAQSQAKLKLNLGKPETTETPEATKQEITDKKVEEEVFTAESGKAEQGIDISMPASKVLDEAEKLFNEKNYDEAVNKLSEIKIK